VIGTSGITCRDRRKGPISRSRCRGSRQLFHDGHSDETICGRSCQICPRPRDHRLCRSGQDRYSHRHSPRTAELLGPIRGTSTACPIEQFSGLRKTRGGRLGESIEVQIHSVRMPSYVLSCEVLFGAKSERLSIRLDAGTSAAPYVSGTLFAARAVKQLVGLRRGLDSIM
jgi:hypothetical protein